MAVSSDRLALVIFIPQLFKKRFRVVFACNNPGKF
jgi:hypothetical protein